MQLGGPLMNNGKYHTESYKQKQAAKLEERLGSVTERTKDCERCNKPFTYLARGNFKRYQKRFCSRSCANSRQEWWNDNAKRYRTIAFQSHKKECYVCGFDKVVAVHHIDENKKNNSLNNLIPLCPNHHEMVHSKWYSEVEPFIKKWQSEFICSGM